MSTYLWLMYQDDKQYEAFVDEKTANRLSYELDSWMCGQKAPLIKFNTLDGSMHTVYLEGLRMYRMGDESIMSTRIETSLSDLRGTK